jgi:hypothetical protein
MTTWGNIRMILLRSTKPRIMCFINCRFSRPLSFISKKRSWGWLVTIDPDVQNLHFRVNWLRRDNIARPELILNFDNDQYPVQTG